MTATARPRPTAEISLAQYAGVQVGLSLGGPLDEILANEGLDPADWPAAEQAWAARLAEETDESLHQGFEQTLSAARARYRRPWPTLEQSLEHWIHFSRHWSAHPSPLALLAELGMHPTELLALQQHWQRRLTAEPGLAEQAQALQAADEPAELPAATPGPLAMTPPPPADESPRLSAAAAPRSSEPPVATGDDGDASPAPPILMPLPPPPPPPPPAVEEAPKDVLDATGAVSLEGLMSALRNGELPFVQGEAQGEDAPRLDEDDSGPAPVSPQVGETMAIDEHLIARVRAAAAMPFEQEESESKPPSAPEPAPPAAVPLAAVPLAAAVPPSSAPPAPLASSHPPPPAPPASSHPPPPAPAEPSVLAQTALAGDLPVVSDDGLPFREARTDELAPAPAAAELTPHPDAGETSYGLPIVAGDDLPFGQGEPDAGAGAGAPASTPPGSPSRKRSPMEMTAFFGKLPVLDRKPSTAADALPFGEAPGGESAGAPEPIAAKLPAHPDAGETSYGVPVVRGDALPFAGQPSDAATGEAPTEEQSSHGDEQPFRAAPLSIRQYAAVRVQTDLDPSGTDRILEQYGLTAALQQALDEELRTICAQDADMARAWEHAYDTYLAWWTEQRRGGG